MIVQDLIVIGGTLAGLSVAIQGRESGLGRVLVLEPGEAVVQPEIVGQHALSVEYQAPVDRISTASNGEVLVETPRLVATAQAVFIALSSSDRSALPAFDLPVSLQDRVHLGEVPLRRGEDVLVVGTGEDAADLTLRLVNAGAGVVLCLGGVDPSSLSRLARRQLLRIEAERKATILWNSTPQAIEDVDGYPMVYFGDRRTPDLQFDRVAFRLEASSGGEVPAPPIDLLDPPPGRVFWIGYADGSQVVSAGNAWDTLRSAVFSDLPAPVNRPRAWRQADREQLESLRSEHYNATITLFERAHSDLWLLRVKPDHGDTSHLAGQYASLGLGYWEPRADSARDRNLEKVWDRLIRRSYSISSPILDEVGYLVDPSRSSQLEFYIVLVPPSESRVPALTPRLALKQPGDRIYLGPKVAGRYTLNAVTDPETRILYLATGTGEAPHNSMILELFRKGHHGPITSVVSVRLQADLAYLDLHRSLEKRFPNYSYLPLVTRQPGVPKRYVQDALKDGTIASLLGGSLDPSVTHVYACGNPSMIGLPEFDDDGEMTFPKVEGICQVLVERGFKLDRRGDPGNIHYEEYW